MTEVGSSQKKHLLTFRVLLNVGIDPNFPQKISFSFLALFREKFANRLLAAIFSLYVNHLERFI